MSRAGRSWTSQSTGAPGTIPTLLGGDQPGSCCPVRVRLGAAGAGSRIVLGWLGGNLQPNTRTWKPKTSVGRGLLPPNEADLGCLRASRVKNKPSSIAGSRKSPHGSDVPSLGGLGSLKPLVPMGTPTLALTPSPAPSRQWDRFPPAPLPGRQLP